MPHQPPSIVHGPNAGRGLIAVAVTACAWLYAADASARAGRRGVARTAPRTENAVRPAPGARRSSSSSGGLVRFVTDKRAYLGSLAELGQLYKAAIGRHYPAMALVQVVALVEDCALVEIEATAVVPEAAENLPGEA